MTERQRVYKRRHAQLEKTIAKAQTLKADREKKLLSTTDPSEKEELRSSLLELNNDLAYWQKEFQKIEDFLIEAAKEKSRPKSSEKNHNIQNGNSNHLPPDILAVAKQLEDKISDAYEQIDRLEDGLIHGPDEETDRIKQALAPLHANIERWEAEYEELVYSKK